MLPCVVPPGLPSRGPAFHSIPQSDPRTIPHKLVQRSQCSHWEYTEGSDSQAYPLSEAEAEPAARASRSKNENEVFEVFEVFEAKFPSRYCMRRRTPARRD